MRYLICMFLFVGACASKKVERVEKVEILPSPEITSQYVGEEKGNLQKEVEYLKGKVQTQDDEIRAYRSHLGLPQKKAKRMITGYDQLGRPKYKDGEFKTLEEELGILKKENNKPAQNTLIYQNTINKGEVIVPSPEPALKRKENVLESFGF